MIFVIYDILTTLGNGLSPMPKTEDGCFFLDANPDFFKIILDWLRLGSITTEDTNLLKGSLALANYFGLEDLMEELKHAIQKCRFLTRKYIPEIIYFHFGKTHQEHQNIPHLEIRKIKLTRVPDSLLAKYFCGELDLQKCYIPISDTKESDHFVIDGNSPVLNRYIFQFFDAESSITVCHYALAQDIPNSDEKSVNPRINEFIKILRQYGILENLHYKIEEKIDSTDLDYNDKYFPYEYFFQWNEEFVLKYIDSE